ncbi:MAG: hypothetical protein F4X97_05100 [Boseongicola sp. SB0662_bin_57]|nr:hypothetical protein [Boseongicola sp. SB0662_bin_57]
MIGDREKESARLQDDDIVQALDIDFDRFRLAPTEPRMIKLRQSVRGGRMELGKLNEESLLPEAKVSLPMNWGLQRKVDANSASR